MGALLSSLKIIIFIPHDNFIFPTYKKKYRWKYATLIFCVKCRGTRKNALMHAHTRDNIFFYALKIVIFFRHFHDWFSWKIINYFLCNLSPKIIVTIITIVTFIFFTGGIGLFYSFPVRSVFFPCRKLMSLRKCIFKQFKNVIFEENLEEFWKKYTG